MKVPRAASLVVLTLGLLAAPLVAEAQAPKRVIRIGWLTSEPRPADLATSYVTFRQTLLTLGYVEGQSYVLEFRFADGVTRLPTLAAELVALPVDLIVAESAPAAQAAKAASTTVPIVFLIARDPVEEGLVQSFARPGGNVTGYTLGVYADKALQVLKEAVPGMSRVGVLCTCPSPQRQQSWLTSAAARTVGVQVQYVDVPDPTGLARALESTANAGLGGLVVPPLAWFGEIHFKQIADFTTTHRLPAIGPRRLFAQAGGPLSFGPKPGQSAARGAALVDKILRGAKPADLPVEAPTLFELVINLKTAKAIGLTIPPSVLTRADQIIE
jgi:putative ABC transport system substrate-binding protein